VNAADPASSGTEQRRPERLNSPVDTSCRRPAGAGQLSPPVLLALCRRSIGRTSIAITAQISAIAAAAVAAEMVDQLWAKGLAILFIGTRQYGLGEVLVHEASHQSLARNWMLNNTLGTLLSWPFFFTFEGYRRFHLQHHLTPLDDPENSIFEEYQDWRLPLSDEPVSARRLFWLLVLRPLTGVIALYHVVGIVSDAYYDSDLKENTAMWSAWAAICVILWQFGLMSLLFLYWLAPLFLVFAALNYWSEVGDHYRTSHLLTRSNTDAWWNSLIGGNIGYHVVHHKYPRIPWFRLKRAHDLLGGDLPGQTTTGLVAAFRVICNGHQQLRPMRHRQNAAN
jgi:fatty acid desaturase